MTPHPTPLTLAAVLAASLLVPACGVEVREYEQGQKKDVDIQTPVGDLSVRAGVDTPNTGLPVYPGARTMREGERVETASVSMATAFFGMEVAAAKFESDDTPDAVLGFYRDQMRTYGAVTECRGDVDFNGKPGAQTPVCQRKPLSREIHLVAGTENRHRLVSVKPHGEGTEFSVVYFQMRGRS